MVGLHHWMQGTCVTLSLLLYIEPEQEILWLDRVALLSVLQYYYCEMTGLIVAVYGGVLMNCPVLMSY